MWRKILKSRELAKKFYKVQVCNGRNTSFWAESWSSLGILKDIVRDGSYIDMGIPICATVEDSMNHRRRNHPVAILNRIEMEIEKVKEGRVLEEDIPIWRNDKGKYKKSFSTKSTWLSIRDSHQQCHWNQAIWFKHATPKYSFISWIAMRGRLATRDRMQYWNGNADVSCALCREPLETLTHLFFECAYSAQVWDALMKGMLKDQHTRVWENLVNLISGPSSWSKMKLYIARYMLQATVHAIWRERNRRRHGELAVPATVMIMRLDKNMRNQFTVIRRRGDKDYEGGMAVWFEARQP